MRSFTNWGDGSGGGYGAAGGSVLLALGRRLALFPVLGIETPYLLFLPAVFFTAWSGGFGPGLLATALSALAADYFLLEPVHALVILRPADQLGMLLYLGMCVLICWWVQRLRRALILTAETRALARQTELLKTRSEASSGPSIRSATARPSFENTGGPSSSARRQLSSPILPASSNM